MSVSSIAATAIDFLARLDPAALPAVGRLFTAILAGDTNKAQREARAAAEAMGIRKLAKATVAARKVLK